MARLYKHRTLNVTSQKYRDTWLNLIRTMYCDNYHLPLED